MAINKKLIHFKTFANFNSQKLSANEANTKYTTGISGTETSGNPDILYQSICFIKDTQQIWTHGQIYNASADGGGEIPTKLSELENDSGFITSDGTSAKANQLTTTRFINGVPFNGTTNVNNFVSCSTAAATAAKTVTIDGFRLLSGAQVRVKFTNANTASSPTLNVNSTGAKSIYYNGLYSTSFTSTSFPFDADKIYTFTYDGTYWRLEGDWLNTVTATSTSANYPLILGPSASAGATITSGDKMLYTDSVNSLYYNPNTNILFAPNLQVTTNLKFPAPSTTYPSANIGMGAKPTGIYNGLVIYNAGGTQSDADFINICASDVFIRKADGSMGGRIIAELQGNASTATTLETPRTINGMTFNGSANVSNYVICDTAADVIVKELTVPNIELTSGTVLYVKFTNGSITGKIQFKINDGSRSNVKLRGESSLSLGGYNINNLDYYKFIFDGSVWWLMPNDIPVIVEISTANYNSTTSGNRLHNGVYYIFTSTASTSMNLTSIDSTTKQSFTMEITTGTSAPTITFPSTWKWVNGVFPVFEANKTYQISTFNNCAVCASFSTAS